MIPSKRGPSTTRRLEQWEIVQGPFITLVMEHPRVLLNPTIFTSSALKLNRRAVKFLPFYFAFINGGKLYTFKELGEMCNTSEKMINRWVYHSLELCETRNKMGKYKDLLKQREETAK